MAPRFKILFNVPNAITLFRLAVIPTIVIAFFIPTTWAKWTIVGLYTAACISDFFDGYLARKLNQYSDFGKLFDPIADKILVAIALILLVAIDRLHGLTLIPTIIILSREILVSGLREFLATYQLSIPVTQLAKWKTTAQMFAIGFLLGSHAVPQWTWTLVVGLILLWVAAVLTLITGYHYIKQGLWHVLRGD